MQFSITDWSGQSIVVHVLLLATRLAVVLALTPILFATQLQAMVRVVLVLCLSLALAMGTLSVSPSVPLPSATALPGHIFLAFLSEAALGALLALSILLAFAAFSMAGRLLDVQVGFGMAQVLDPVTRQQTPVLNSLFNQLAVVVFFLLDGHHALLRGLAYSLERFPVGQAWSMAGLDFIIIKQVGVLFGMGFALAAPVAGFLLLVEFVLGIISRNLPQMNMLALGIPVKILAGLLALALWQSGMGQVMSQVYRTIYLHWDQVFQGVALEGRN